MRTKLYGRARPPGESYIFAAMLVKCGRSCQSAHRPVACARSNTRQRRVSVSLPTALRVISTEVDISSFAAIPPRTCTLYSFHFFACLHGRKKDENGMEYVLLYWFLGLNQGGEEDTFFSNIGDIFSFFSLLGSIKKIKIIKGECKEIFHARVFVPLRQRRSFLLLRTVKLLSSHLVLIQFRDYSLRVE